MTTSAKTQPRKAELASLLASTEPSVFFGEQAERYWHNVYMRTTRDELVARVEKRLDKLTSTTLDGQWGAYQDWAMAKFEDVA